MKPHTGCDFGDLITTNLKDLGISSVAAELVDGHAEEDASLCQTDNPSPLPTTTGLNDRSSSVSEQPDTLADDGPHAVIDPSSSSSRTPKTCAHWVFTVLIISHEKYQAQIRAPGCIRGLRRRRRWAGSRGIACRTPTTFLTSVFAALHTWLSTCCDCDCSTQGASHTT